MNAEQARTESPGSGPPGVPEALGGQCIPDARYAQYVLEAPYVQAVPAGQLAARARRPARRFARQLVQVIAVRRGGPVHARA